MLKEAVKYAYNVYISGGFLIGKGIYAADTADDEVYLHVLFGRVVKALYHFGVDYGIGLDDYMSGVFFGGKTAFPVDEIYNSFSEIEGGNHYLVPCGRL